MVDQGKPDRTGRRVAVVGSGVTGLTVAWVLDGSARPSARLFADTVATGTGLRVTERFSMGGHYAHTPRLWQERFDGYTDRTSALGFDPCSSACGRFYPDCAGAGFRSGYLDVERFVLMRRGEV
ncbi:class I SAM-dependent methyltransferase [Nocardia testacea]|uniref:class I SAM-dependent methyltransferase n=1 Tax=Nocardia testacea TaxID=248551 RepID=UPI0002EA9913|nr:class I SAM-dependent methyltransferase [Nocardia testacea]